VSSRPARLDGLSYADQYDIVFSKDIDSKKVCSFVGYLCLQGRNTIGLFCLPSS
jgi:hypothetical protein